MKKEKFYSIQRKEALEEAKKTGILKANEELETFHEAYEWMKDQMEERINGYSRDEGIIWLFTDKEQALIRKQALKLDDNYRLVEIKCSRDKVLGSLYYPWSTIVSLYDLYGQIREYEFYLLHGISIEEIFDLEEHKNETAQYCTGAIKYKNIKIIL